MSRAEVVELGNRAFNEEVLDQVADLVTPDLEDAERASRRS